MKVKNLRALREQRLLTQEALARQAGVSRPTVANLEAGGSAYMGSIRKIARALGVDPQVLLRID